MTESPRRKAVIKPPPLVVSRVFPASRATVFQAWSSADHMKRWFCPECFTVPEANVDFRPGGVCDICMRAPDGQDFWSRGHFVEIVEAERLVFESSLIGGDGAPAFTALATVTFEDADGGTLMTVTQAYEIFDRNMMAAVAGASEGWRTTLDRLEQEVARIQQTTARSAVHGTFTLERSFRASPATVFHAFTDKEAKGRWFVGGDGYEAVEREIDVRPNGRERLVGRWASGTVSTFDAVYHDVVAGQRLVYSYLMHIDGRKISVSLATVELSPEGAGTRLSITEQGVFLDGYDDAGARERGTGLLLDRVATSLGE